MADPIHSVTKDRRDRVRKLKKRSQIHGRGEHEMRRPTLLRVRKVCTRNERLGIPES